MVVAPFLKLAKIFIQNIAFKNRDLFCNAVKKEMLPYFLDL